MRTAGIIGYGHFGVFAHELFKRFAPDIRVAVFSSRHAPDGETFFSLGDVMKSDAVFLCVPIAVYEETIKRVVPLMGAETILVDIATVKLHTAELLRRLAAGKRYVAMHPMFGPESYAKRGHDVTGLRVIVCEHTLPAEEYATYRDALKKCGFEVVEMTADRHDKHLAETLFLTHFVGQVIIKTGFERTEIDTVSFGYLMDAVESVKNDEALFRDVFQFNPYCKNVLDAFEGGEHDVRRMLEK
jgi:prephenate dehydrogenase